MPVTDGRATRPVRGQTDDHGPTSVTVSAPLGHRPRPLSSTSRVARPSPNRRSRSSPHPTPSAPATAWQARRVPPEQGQVADDHAHAPPGPPPARRLPPFRPGHHQPGPCVPADPRRRPGRGAACPPPPASPGRRVPRAGELSARGADCPAAGRPGRRRGSRRLARRPGGRGARPDRCSLGRPRHPPDARVHRPRPVGPAAVPRAARRLRDVLRAAARMEIVPTPPEKTLG
jgi:hypothetical protein